MTALRVRRRGLASASSAVWAGIGSTASTAAASRAAALRVRRRGLASVASAVSTAASAAAVVAPCGCGAAWPPTASTGSAASTATVGGLGGLAGRRRGLLGDLAVDRPSAVSTAVSAALRVAAACGCGGAACVSDVLGRPSTASATTASSRGLHRRRRPRLRGSGGRRDVGARPRLRGASAVGRRRSRRPRADGSADGRGHHDRLRRATARTATATRSAGLAWPRRPSDSVRLGGEPCWLLRRAVQRRAVARTATAARRTRRTLALALGGRAAGAAGTATAAARTATAAGLAEVLDLPRPRGRRGCARSAAGHPWCRPGCSAPRRGAGTWSTSPAGRGSRGPAPC